MVETSVLPETIQSRPMVDGARTPLTRCGWSCKTTLWREQESSWSLQVTDDIIQEPGRRGTIDQPVIV